MKKLSTALLICFLFATPAFAADQVPNTLQQVIDDSTLQHEAKPEGVPSTYSWVDGPTIYHLDQVPPPLLGQFHALEGWGQVYVASGGSKATNVRVQIRNLNTYVFRLSDMQWHLIQDAPMVIGAAYTEDFQSGPSISIPIRDESANGGGISVKLIPGYNFHFFAPYRAVFSPGNDMAVYTTYEARLIIDNPALPDDRAIARLVADAGCDVYTGMTEVAPAGGEPHVGIGRFVFLTNQWQSFDMMTMTIPQVQKFPMPL